MFEELRLRYQEDKKEIWKEAGLRLISAACIFSIALSVSVLFSAFLQGVTNPMVILLPAASAGGAVLLRLLVEVVLSHLYLQNEGKDRKAAEELMRVLIPVFWGILLVWEDPGSALLLLSGTALLFLADALSGKKKKPASVIKVVLTDLFTAGVLILLLREVQKETVSLSSAILTAYMSRRLLETAAAEEHRIRTGRLSQISYLLIILFETGILMVSASGLDIAKEGLFSESMTQHLIWITVFTCLHALLSCLSIGKLETPARAGMVSGLVMALIAMRLNVLSGIIFLFCTLIMGFVLPFFASLIHKGTEKGYGYVAAGHAVSSACLFFLCVFITVQYMNDMITACTGLIIVSAWWASASYPGRKRQA